MKTPREKLDESLDSKEGREELFKLIKEIGKFFGVQPNYVILNGSRENGGVSIGMSVEPMKPHETTLPSIVIRGDE